MPDLSTLQAIDAGTFGQAPTAAPVAAGPAPSAPQAAVATPSSLSGGDDAISVVGPATIERWQANPPAPPSADLTGYARADAQSDYAAYQQWLAQNAQPAGKQPATPSQYQFVAPASTPGAGVGMGGTGAGTGAAGAPQPTTAATAAPAASTQGAAAATQAAGSSTGQGKPSGKLESPGDFVARLEALSSDTGQAGGQAGAGASGGGSAQPSAAPASAPGAASKQPAPLTGYGANIGAGINDAIAGTFGAPVDLVTGGINALTGRINSVTGANIPAIANPVGGSNWLRSAMGLMGADPRNVVPGDIGQQLARAGAAGATSALLPMGAAGQIARAAEAAAPVVSGVAQTLADAPAAATGISGAAAGVTGQGAADAAQHAGVNPKYIPLIDTAGQIIGGGLGAIGTGAAMAGARGASAAGRTIAGVLPVETSAPIVGADNQPIAGTSGEAVTARPSVLNAAAAKATQAAGMSAPDLSAALERQGASVPGSVPTVGQQTGNTGLLHLERNLVFSNQAAREAFADRRVQQNQAQAAHLETLRPEDAQAAAAGHYFVNRLNAIDAQEQAAIDAARAQYEAQARSLPVEQHAADIGRDMQAAVDAEHAPRLALADKAVEMAQRHVAGVAEQIGGNRADVPGGHTARQFYGEQLQERIGAIRNAAKAERNALYEARDPEGKLAISGNPIASAARGLRRELIPEAGDSFTGREEELIGRAEKMAGVQPMRHIAALRKNINAALKEATAGQNTGATGAAEAVRRFTILKNAVDQAEQEATERAAAKEGAAVVSGKAAPADTVAGRLATHAAGGDRAPPNTGSTVYTPNGRAVGVGYRVVEADSLTGSHDQNMTPNAAFPAELQPRDRTRAASAQQVQNMARNLQPERLGASTSAAEGAPIVGPDGVVESGNARLLAIKAAHAAGGDASKAYRQFLTDQGYDVSNMRAPVLVRERVTPLSPIERVAFSREANASSGLAMSASERAKIDADRLPQEAVELWRPGDVDSAGNREFVRSFVKHAVDTGEVGSLMTKNGTLSLEGAQRIRNALLQKAYGDSGLVAALSESGDESIKSLGAAMTDAAGAMARVRTEVRAGNVSPAVDISHNLVEAARAVAQAREKGISLRDYVAQGDVLGGGVSEQTAEVLRAAYGENLSGRVSRQKLASVLNSYAEEAMQQGTQARLFGQNATSGEILQGALRRYEGRNGTGPSEGLASGAGPAGSSNAQGGAGVRGSVDAAAGKRDSGQIGSASGPTEENLTAEDVARFKAADAFNREYMERFGPKTPAGQVLAKGPGGNLAMEQSKVAGQFWKRGPAGAESTQNLVDAFGSPAAAERAIADYAAHDLKAAASGPGGLSADKLSKWLADHEGALNTFPALRERLGTLVKAQGILDEVAKARTAIEERNPIKPGSTGAETLGQFVKPGPKGGEAVDSYLANTGNTPAARAALTDGFTYALRADATKGGELTAQGLAAFNQKYASALDRLPELKEQFANLATARAAVDEAAARAMQERKAYLSSVVRHYLTGAGEPVEPEKAVASILGSKTGPADVADLMRRMSGDPEAIKGLRASFADWISRQVSNTAEVGASGVSEISPAKLQKLVNNPATMAVLRKVFTPEQVAGVLELVAADARMTARTFASTKIPGSPGTAADARAGVGFDAHGDVPGALLAETGGEVAGKVLGMSGIAGLLLRGGAIAGRIYYGAAKQAGIQARDDLLTQMVLNPDLMRAVLAAAKMPTPTPSIMSRIGGLLGNLSLAGGTMPAAPRAIGQN